MWRISGRPGAPGQGYSITDGQITLIVPYSQKERGVQYAIDYLNTLMEGHRVSGKKICASCNRRMSKIDKFWFRPDGRIEHRHCDNPTNY